MADNLPGEGRMDKEAENFVDAHESFLKAVIFENWLRFHFITEKADEKPWLEIPEKSLEKIKNLYAPFLPLAEELNHAEITFAASRQAICAWFVNYLEERGQSPDKAAEILNSREFHNGLELFHAWLALHETQLGGGFLEFAVWLELFGQWRAGPGAAELLVELNAGK